MDTLTRQELYKSIAPYRFIAARTCDGRLVAYNTSLRNIQKDPIDDQKTRFISFKPISFMEYSQVEKETKESPS